MNRNSLTIWPENGKQTKATVLPDFFRFYSPIVRRSSGLIDELLDRKGAEAVLDLWQILAKTCKLRLKGRSFLLFILAPSFGAQSRNWTRLVLHANGVGRLACGHSVAHISHTFRWVFAVYHKKMWRVYVIKKLSPGARRPAGQGHSQFDPFRIDRQLSEIPFRVSSSELVWPCVVLFIANFMLFFQISLFNNFLEIPKTKGWTLFSTNSVRVVPALSRETQASLKSVSLKAPPATFHLESLKGKSRCSRDGQVKKLKRFWSGPQPEAVFAKGVGVRQLSSFELYAPQFIIFIYRLKIYHLKNRT